MKNSAVFSCEISTTDPAAALGCEIWLDHAQLFDSAHVTETVKVRQAFEDFDGDHVLRIVMKNKQSDHTTVDAQGQIVKDACLTVNSVAFDDIGLGHVLAEQAVYEHDFNGTAEPTQQKFYGTLGCNGTVTLSFTSPIYMWLLENM